MDYMIWVWLGFVVAMIIIEALTMDLICCWFIVGGFLGIILASCNVPLYVQLIVALAASFLCLIFLRKIAFKLLKNDKGKTNLDLIIGQKIKLIDPVTDDNVGTARCNGLVWNVISENNSPIPSGTTVEVKSIQGNKLIVLPEIPKATK